MGEPCSCMQLYFLLQVTREFVSGITSHMHVFKRARYVWQNYKLISVQGVVTYMSHVEVWDWDQNWMEWSKHFWEADQGIKVTCKLLKINNQERGRLQFDSWHFGNQVIKSLRRDQSSTLDHGHKCFYRQHISDYPMALDNEFHTSLWMVWLKYLFSLLHYSNKRRSAIWLATPHFRS